MQQSISYSSQNSITSNPTKSSKIHPLIQILNKKILSEESMIQKFLSSNSKAFTTAEYIPDQDEELPKFLNQYQKALKTQQKLSIFSYFVNFRISSEAKYLLSTIKYLSSLSTLSLTLSDCSLNNQPIFLKALSKSFTSLKNLTHLEISFISVKFQDPRPLRILLKCLKKLPNLTNLAFIFQYKSSFNNEVIAQNFSLYLSKLTQLRALKLSFDHTIKTTDQEIIQLSSAFKRFTQLTKLDINFSMKIRTSTLLNLFTSLQNVSDLALDLSRYRVFTENDDDVETALTHLDCSKLNKLHLYLFGNYNEKCFTQLSIMLQKATLLTTLCLEFPPTRSLHEVGDEVLDLLTTLSSLSALTSLQLIFPSSLKIKDLALHITTLLPPLTQLTHLTLDFQADNETESSHFQQLFSNIRQLNSLKYLDLCFPSEKTITDESLFTLAESLKGKIQLRNLALDFGRESQMTNKGVYAILSVIKGMKNLFSLALKFRENERINEETVNQIRQTLKYLPVLYFLKLTFQDCGKIASFEGLFEKMKEMRNITEIDLFLPYSESNCKEANYLCKTRTSRIVWA